MRKRVSKIVAAALLCGRLALAGAMALPIVGLLDDGPTAQAQESGGGAEPELTERRKGRIAERQDACAADGVSGQAATLASLPRRFAKGTSHDCSLHPFDIMAIQALYQSIN